ncbi:TlpA family protein disulfide reductase [Alkalicoccus chagannorensis]
MLKETLPNIKLHDVDGGPVETDDLRGRNVLIFMWASW